MLHFDAESCLQLLAVLTNAFRTLRTILQITYLQMLNNETLDDEALTSQLNVSHKEASLIKLRKRKNAWLENAKRSSTKYSQSVDHDGTSTYFQ